MSAPVPLVHGTLTAYTAKKCRCEECKTVARRYGKRWRRARALGHPSPRVSSAPLLPHVQRLQASGMTIRDIARAAGWKSQESLRAALRNPTVSRETLRRALAIRPNDHRQVAREFPGFMLTRRLQALAAMGWSAREIADRSGVSIFRIREVRFGSADSMYRSTAEPLLTLYEDLQDRVGGSESTRRLAQRNGWLPPAAWDNIDNPDEKPRPKKWQRRIPDAA